MNNLKIKIEEKIANTEALLEFNKTPGVEIPSTNPSLVRLGVLNEILALIKSEVNHE